MDRQHIDLGFAESCAAAPTRFEKWCAEVEAIVGHELDGDQDRDGYSVDGALDVFCSGRLPSEYAAEIIARAADQVAEEERAAAADAQLAENRAYHGKGV